MQWSVINLELEKGEGSKMNTVGPHYSGHIGECETVLINGVSSFQVLASPHYLLMTAQTVIRNMSGLTRCLHIRGVDLRGPTVLEGWFLMQTKDLLRLVHSVEKWA